MIEKDYFLKEPPGRIHFLNDKRRREHFIKHILDREERWTSIPEFDADLIARARQGDEVAINALERVYEDLISDIVLENCRKGVLHRHIMLVPHPILLKAGKQPRIQIQCYGILENLVIYVSAFVTKNQIKPYYILTGYRTFPKLSMKSWLKRQMAREREESELKGGNRVYLIADHLQL